MNLNLLKVGDIFSEDLYRIIDIPSELKTKYIKVPYTPKGRILHITPEKHQKVDPLFRTTNQLYPELTNYFTCQLLVVLEINTEEGKRILYFDEIEVEIDSTLGHCRGSHITIIKQRYCLKLSLIKWLLETIGDDCLIVIQNHQFEQFANLIQRTNYEVKCIESKPNISIYRLIAPTAMEEIYLGLT